LSPARLAQEQGLARAFQTPLQPSFTGLVSTKYSIMIFTALLALALPATGSRSSVLLQTQLSRKAGKTLLVTDKAACLQGKLLPSLYILGAQKAATSSLFDDLASLGVWNVNSQKEFHFFDNWQEKAGNYSTLAMSEWRNRMPQCNAESTEQRVLMDATPCNIRMVPLPHGTRPTGSHWGRYFLTHKGSLQNTVGTEMDLPRLLQQLYSEHQEKMVFVVMLRSPLSRMQSAWYHSKVHVSFELPWEQCWDCKAKTFAKGLAATIARASSSTPTYDDWLWASMYGRQLQHWMSVFDPSHFVIVPQYTYVKDGHVKVCTDIAQKLHVSLNCQALEGRAGRFRNAHKHPPLQHDVTQELFNNFGKIMAREDAILFETLAYAHVHGATLVGYNGSAGKPDQVKEWLSSSW